MTFDSGNIMDYRSALSELRQETSGLPIREGAAELGISEGELLAAHCGDGVRRLDGDWVPLLARLGALGPLVILTRNDHAILQRRAPFPRMGLGRDQILGAGLGWGLALRPERWAHGFAVMGEGPAGPRPSFQFFDASGRATHKVFPQEPTGRAAFEALAERHQSSDQSPVWAPRHASSRLPRPEGPLGAGAPARIWRVAPESLGGLLLEAGSQDLVLQVAVPSSGALQSQTGRMKTLHRKGPWLQVLDPAFTFSLNLKALGSSWVAGIPEEDGEAYALHCLAPCGDLVAELRGPGRVWRDLVYSLPTAEG